MLPLRQGSFPLFRFAGIEVSLHWSWLLVAFYGIQNRVGAYSSPLWNVFEYLALFGIVLLHEFGHSLACRSVGGQADHIILWPLGGVAFVAPPPRPGATLWSIAAGPLVNVVLAPLLFGLFLLVRHLDWDIEAPNLVQLIRSVAFINLGLLIFNLLPVYPLDGGQIVRSLLWFVVGPARSLMLASILGFVGVAALGALALWEREIWLGVIAVFVLLNCWNGLRRARQMARLAAAPRHADFACPSCGTHPPAGAFWTCARCHQSFDTFARGAVCPHCGAAFYVTSCPECGRANPISAWVVAPPPFN